jgi:hypothetical protein
MAHPSDKLDNKEITTANMTARSMAGRFFWRLPFHELKTGRLMLRKADLIGIVPRH